MKCIIALCGLKRCGKDVAARYISEKYGHTHVKLAQPLKDVLKTAFRFTDDDLETDSKDQISPKWGVSPRTLMNYIGTQVFQYDIANIVPQLKDRCFWIDHLLHTYIEQDKIVISDLRFHHEVRRIREYVVGSDCVFRVVRICRNGTSHGSIVSEMESAHLQVDMVLNNNGTIKELYDQLDVIMKKI